MKADVLRMLRNEKDYVSGQDICDKLQVSRTAVWKVMKQLQAEGYDIEAVNNKVIYLKRMIIGNLILDESLELGCYRELTDEEIELIKGKES